MDVSEIVDQRLAKKREQESIDFLGKAISELMKSPVIKNAMAVALDEMLASWSGDSFLKRKFSAQILKTAGAGEIAPFTDSAIWKNGLGVPSMLALAPVLINSAASIFLKMLVTVRQYSPEEQANFFRTSIAQLDAARLGEVVTEAARNFSALLKENPTLAAELLEKPLDDMLKKIDFGELTELLENSAEGITAVSGVVGATLWNHPGKLACLEIMSMGLINILVSSLNEMLKPMKNASPESTTDLVFAVVDTFDGRKLGEVFNAVLELFRKINTGSVILGEGDKSVFQAVLANKLREINSVLDPVLVRKAKIAWAENREAAVKSTCEAARENPRIFMETLAALSAIKNPAIRSAGVQLKLFEELPAAEVDAACARGLGELDMQEIGEIFNSLLRAVNRVHAGSPDLSLNLLGTLATAVDTRELKKAADWIVDDVVSCLKPAAQAVMPAVLRGLNELLAPENGNSEIDEALALLRNRICMQGGCQR
ncbi:MAG: hypothetical protein ABFD62_03720 [Syntrophaceae bacterium]